MPLKGIKVLELAGLAPAPFCGMLLSDFGASVTRIDKIGANANLDCLGNGKLSICVNLKHSEGVKIVRSLARKSDVLIEPFRKGIMENLGLGPEILMKDNPKLIYARLTGYGQSGPYCKSAGHDINYIGLSGLLSLFGRAGDKPVFPVNLAADFGGGGLMCALGIILALYERRSSNLGQIIDTSMVEGSSYLGSWLYRSQKLPIWGQERGHNILDTGAHFYEVYKTKDNKFIAVGAIEPQFYENLLEGLDLNYDDVPQFENFNKAKQIFQKKFKEKTQMEWCQIFDKLDACVTPILSLDEAPKHKHNLERASFVKTNDGFVPKPAPNLSRTPGNCSAVKATPHRGEHTKQVLGELGYDGLAIDTLEKDGTVECYKVSKL